MNGLLLKNSKIIKAEAINGNTVILIMKSKCRHYSMVELTLDVSKEGDTDLFITDVKSRCGLRKCAEKIF